MSLSRLASQHVQRVTAATTTKSGLTAVADPDRDDRFDLLVKYIPTETLTLFVAAMAARDAIAEAWPRIDAWSLYGIGAALTPAVYALAAYGKQRAALDDGPFRPASWPMVASLIAFLAWGLSVPGLVEDDGGKILAAFCALCVSTLLSLIEPVFAPRARRPDAGGLHHFIQEPTMTSSLKDFHECAAHAVGGWVRDKLDATYHEAWGNLIPRSETEGWLGSAKAWKRTARAMIARFQRCIGVEIELSAEEIADAGNDSLIAFCMTLAMAAANAAAPVPPRHDHPRADEGSKP